MNKNSTLDYIKNAFLNLVYDFRAYLMPDTKLLTEWKNRKLTLDAKGFTGKPIVVCTGKMVDDAEAMLTAYRQSIDTTNGKKGSNAILPIVMLAFGTIGDPPDNNRTVASAYFTPCILNGKQAKVRFRQKNVRCQLAFFSASQSDASTLADEFVAYLSIEEKRRFSINFKVGDDNGDIAPVDATIWDNIPNAMDVPLQDNLYVFTVDVIITVPVPLVIFEGKNNIDNGITKPDMLPKEVEFKPSEDCIKRADARYYANTDKGSVLEDHSRMEYHDSTKERDIKTGLKDND